MSTVRNAEHVVIGNVFRTFPFRHAVLYIQRLRLNFNDTRLVC